MDQVHVKGKGQEQKHHHSIIENSSNVCSLPGSCFWLFASLQVNWTQIDGPRILPTLAQKKFHSWTKFYTVSAAGQTPLLHCPSATFHAKSSFGILVETAQEGAICAGDFIPPSGNTFWWWLIWLVLIMLSCGTVIYSSKPCQPQDCYYRYATISSKNSAFIFLSLSFFPLSYPSWPQIPQKPYSSYPVFFSYPVHDKDLIPP